MRERFIAVTIHLEETHHCGQVIETIFTPGSWTLDMEGGRLDPEELYLSLPHMEKGLRLEVSSYTTLLTGVQSKNHRFVCKTCGEDVLSIAPPSTIVSPANL